MLSLIAVTFIERPYGNLRENAEYYSCRLYFGGWVGRIGDCETYVTQQDFVEYEYRHPEFFTDPQGRRFRITGTERAAWLYHPPVDLEKVIPCGVDGGGCKTGKSPK